ncbi:MAG: response regulator [Puniceicoccales bacterium]
MTLNTPLTILVVEDHDVVRRGLRNLVEDEEDLTLVGEAGTCTEALNLYEATKPAVVLLDIMLPDGNGVELCRRLKESTHQARILILTSCDEETKIFDAFSAGADGYALKTANGETLLDAIRDVSTGRTYLDPSAATHVVNHIRHEASPKEENPIRTLSDQEFRVLEKVSEGLTNKEVAAQLKLSEKTVKNYFSNVLSKLYVSRRTEAAAIYWKHQQR